MVLLEFWVPHYRGFLEAVPEINGFQEKYADTYLKIYGIEFTKPDEKGLQGYIDKYDIAIPTLYTGKATAKKYGASAAPTFFLIDRNGSIVYSSIGLRKEELLNAIEEHI